jgi:uncharacterized membrane protein
MPPHTTGLIIGGLLPALFFGLSTVFAKPANQIGISTSFYLIFVGLAVILVGLGLGVIWPDRTLSLSSGAFAMLVGLSWGTAAGLVAIALAQYQMPIAKLAPLFNMNTLVAVGLGLLIFAEAQDVNVPQLIIGALLITLGGWLVASS